MAPLKAHPYFQSLGTSPITKKRKINLYSTELSFSEVMWLNKRKESGRNKTLGVLLGFWDLNFLFVK